MIWHDYSREWKGYQRTFAQLERETTRTQVDEAQAALDQDQVQALEQELQSANDALFQNKQAIDELEAKRKEMSDERYLVDIEERELKSVYRLQEVLLRRGRTRPRRKGCESRRVRSVATSIFRRSRDAHRLGLRAGARGQKSSVRFEPSGHVSEGRASRSLSASISSLASWIPSESASPMFFVTSRLSIS